MLREGDNSLWGKGGLAHHRPPIQDGRWRNPPPLCWSKPMLSFRRAIGFPRSGLGPRACPGSLGMGMVSLRFADGELLMIPIEESLSVGSGTIIIAHDSPPRDGDAGRRRLSSSASGRLAQLVQSAWFTPRRSEVQIL